MNPFSVAIFGDMQNQNEITSRIIGQVVNKQPDLCIILGDLVATGHDQDQWTNCERLLDPLRDVCEVVALPGNHDYERAGVADNFRARFRQANAPSYLSLQRGGCRFILLDTMLYDDESLEQGHFPPDSAQATWLRRELQLATDHQEPAFVCGHHPIFMAQELYFCTSTTIRFDDASGPSLGNLLPILLEGNAQMYFAGHVHLYEKSRYQDRLFITSGATSYGPPAFPIGGNPFAEMRQEKYHFCYLELDQTGSGQRMARFQAVDEWGDVFDAWQEPLHVLSQSAS